MIIWGMYFMYLEFPVEHYESYTILSMYQQHLFVKCDLGNTTVLSNCQNEFNHHSIALAIKTPFSMSCIRTSQYQYGNAVKKSTKIGVKTFAIQLHKVCSQQDSG